MGRTLVQAVHHQGCWVALMVGRESLASIQRYGQFLTQKQHTTLGWPSNHAGAFRPALAELYFKDMNGFFLLDDPFTDMNAARRTTAIQALGTFADQRQVLFFTCHADHARELQDLGAGRLQVSGYLVS